jgi:hypothetical protein
VISGIDLTVATKSPRKIGNHTTKNQIVGSGTSMKTTQKIIKNLKNKVAEKKAQVMNQYTMYIYTLAITQVLEDKLGDEPRYIDIDNLPYVG